MARSFRATAWTTAKCATGKARTFFWLKNVLHSIIINYGKEEKK